jgi:radical SAM-linked protein
MQKIRIKYEKTGKAMYISHLDLTATMQRAFLRAGIKLKYSEGFNPHPYMSVALPLSVGNESICELMDIAISDNELPDIDIIKLPEGIKVLDVYRPVRKFSEIKWVEIAGTLHYETQLSDSLIEKLMQCYSKKNITISKRTKRGNKELDIAPFINDISFSISDAIVFSAKISAQNPTINAGDIISALDEKSKPEYLRIKRIEIYNSNMILFR